MNTSLSFKDLTLAERNVGELYAWGMTVKEIAMKLGKSISTVKNQLVSIFLKTQTTKGTEFAAWYFCTRFQISFDLSPVKRMAVTICLLTLIGVSTFNSSLYTARIPRARRYSRTQTMRRSRRSDKCFEYEPLS